jgi:REP element-mobilizing transposase RayT
VSRASDGAKGGAMGHTFTTIRIHVVFSTKDRLANIAEDIQPRLWDYIGGIGRNHRIPIHAVGGTDNHAHVLLSLPPTMFLSKAVQTIKAYSSKWINEERLAKGRFAWQDGYGAFSVSQSNVDAVIDYIHNQPEHHRKHSFEDEFRSLLLRHGIKIDKYTFG